MDLLRKDRQAVSPDVFGISPLNTPPLPSERCERCLCPDWWEDLRGRLHCCECELIPSRLAAARFWMASSDGSWKSYQPQRWNPWAHLEAAQADRDAVRAAAETF